MNNDYKEKMLADIARWKRKTIHNYRTINFVVAKRKCEKWSNSFLYGIYWLMYKRLEIKFSCDIPAKLNVGKGLCIQHLNGIVINPDCIIGENCTILNGVLIGNERRGKRAGTPKIGDNVYIGSNATIVGNITVGDDVLIAPGTYINFDVPPHSVVFGNPGIIKHRDYATEGYIKE